MDEDDMIDQVASIMGFDESETDRLRLELMERHEKANTLLKSAEVIGKTFSVNQDGEVFVSVGWLGTLLLIEADHIIKGHGGCADHMRVIDLLQTTVVAAHENAKKELDSTDDSVVD